MPGTPLDEGDVYPLPESGVSGVHGLTQELEQVWHDEKLKVSTCCPVFIVGPAMNANIVNVHIHDGAHHHSSRLAIEAMRAAT